MLQVTPLGLSFYSTSDQMMPTVEQQEGQTTGRQET